MDSHHHPATDVLETDLQQQFLRPDDPYGVLKYAVRNVTFSGEEGRGWTVWEVPAGVSPGPRGSASLVFVSVHAMRRVWSYPSDWATLPPTELRKLSWQR